jgi:hypothetical protein
MLFDHILSIAMFSYNIWPLKVCTPVLKKNQVFAQGGGQYLSKADTFFEYPKYQLLRMKIISFSENSRC